MMRQHRIKLLAQMTPRGEKQPGSLTYLNVLLQLLQWYQLLPHPRAISIHTNRSRKTRRSLWLPSALLERMS